MYIAVDAAGGDIAPRNISAGALVAARYLGFGLTLVGERSAIETELTRTFTTRVGYLLSRRGFRGFDDGWPTPRWGAH